MRTSACWYYDATWIISISFLFSSSLRKIPQALSVAVVGVHRGLFLGAVTAGREGYDGSAGWTVLFRQRTRNRTAALITLIQGQHIRIWRRALSCEVKGVIWDNPTAPQVGRDLKLMFYHYAQVYRISYFGARIKAMCGDNKFDFLFAIRYILQSTNFYRDIDQLTG